MSVGLRDELFALRNKLELLEKELTDQMMSLEVRADKWAKIDEEIEAVLKSSGNSIVMLDVGGKKFQTKLETLLSFKDSVFYILAHTKKLDFKNEIFIDRESTYFHIILSFLRNKKVNLNNYDSIELNQIREEAEFYGIYDLITNIDEEFSQIYLASVEISGDYMINNAVAGSKDVKDLNNHSDRSMTKGVVANSPGWIIFELTRCCEFDEIEIGGWGGNTGYFSHSNGASASIYTSTDKASWINVGASPSNYTMINKSKITKTKAKYIKFQSSSYVGIGFLKINRTGQLTK